MYKKQEEFESMPDFQKGFEWAVKDFEKKVAQDGEIGVQEADKAIETCHKMAYDENCKVTKRGIPLRDDLRAYYAGLEAGYTYAYRRSPYCSS